MYREDANTLNYCPINNFSNHSTRSSKHRKPRANQSTRRELRLTNHKPRKNSMEIGDIVQFMDTNGLNTSITLPTNHQPPTKKLLKPRYPNDYYKNNVRDINTHYYTKNFKIQATDHRQDQNIGLQLLTKRLPTESILFSP